MIYEDLKPGDIIQFDTKYIILMHPELVPVWMDGSSGRYDKSLKDLEFVTFHPTNGRATFWTSDWVRGSLYLCSMPTKDEQDMYFMLNPVAGKRYQDVINFYKRGLTQEEE